MGPDPEIENQGGYKTVQRTFHGAISEMAKKKNSEKVVARQNAGRQKDSNTPDEDEAHKSSSDEDFDTSESLGKLVKADLLAAALKNATELAELRKQAKTRATSERKSKIADDNDDGDADGLSDGEQETFGEKNKENLSQKTTGAVKTRRAGQETSSKNIINRGHRS